MAVPREAAELEPSTLMPQRVAALSIVSAGYSAPTHRRPDYCIFFLRKKRKNSNLPKLPALFYIYLKTDCAALSLRIDVGHISAMRVGGATGRHKVRRKLEERLREKKKLMRRLDWERVTL